MLSINYILAQAPIQEGSTDYNADLWHLRDIGIGEKIDPKAKLHIFNEKYVHPIIGENLPKTTFRPFLITGSVINTDIPQNQLAIFRNYSITVNKFGFFGIDIMDPLTKLHLHKGTFTISTNGEAGMVRWEIHGKEKAFAIKDFNANKYRFWINKNDGNVGIGTTSPDEKLEVNGGLLKIVNNGINTTIGSQNANFSHFITDAPKFYFNKSIYVNGAVSSYNSDLLLQANGTTGIRVKTNGKVNIGNTSIASGSHTDYKLSVDGKIVSKKVVVTLDNWADKVFENNYDLRTLKEVEQFIEENKHLPEIPSEAEVLENGVELGKMNTLLLQKVEELTLYMIQMQKEIEELKSEKQ